MRRLMIPILCFAAVTALAQKKEPKVTPTNTTTEAATAAATYANGDSHATREEFRELLRRLPPEVGVVLKLDPTLFNNQQYLATYPALGGFVATHPDVIHSPAFYLES